MNKNNKDDNISQRSSFEPKGQRPNSAAASTVTYTQVMMVLELDVGEDLTQGLDYERKVYSSKNDCKENQIIWEGFGERGH